jgi:2-polyprenyl-6-methoxyphenol hydroxylase-like FAD-dependent oxidoreductase
MPRSFDVAIVGGGIAGGALACALSRSGFGVLLLERQQEYRDRVLGEGMMPWGVADARSIGIEDALLDNPEGTVTLTHWFEYRMDREPAEVEREALDQPFSEAVEGVDGALCLRHPVACEAFANAAHQTGATVVRGVREVTVGLGQRPSVSWSANGQADEATARLVVGADGKVSSVRRQAAIDLREEDPPSFVAGMLAGGLSGTPTTIGYSANETDRFLIAFPQPNDRARLYVCVPPGDRTRFTGAHAAERFLAAWASPFMPHGAAVASARQEGPCATFPLNSAVVDEFTREGLVLVGDAAGWIDPLIGQGLAMAMRDARLITEALLDNSEWSPAIFSDYADDRRKRLEILALNARVQQRLDVDFSPDFAPRRLEVVGAVWADSVFSALMSAQFAGPEAADPAVFEPAELDRLGSLLYGDAVGGRDPLRHPRRWRPLRARDGASSPRPPAPDQPQPDRSF